MDFLHSMQDLFHRIVLSPIPCILCVTERTSKITPSHPDEYCRLSASQAFALYGREDLSYLQNMWLRHLWIPRL